MQEVILRQQRGISISKKGRKLLFYLREWPECLLVKEGIVWASGWQLKPWKSSKWSLNTKANVIVKKRWADHEGEVVWGEDGEGRHLELLSGGVPPEKLCTPSEIPRGPPSRCTWWCQAQCLEPRLNLPGLVAEGHLPNTATYLPISFHPLPFLYTSVSVLPVLDAINKWLYLPFSLTLFEFSAISGNRITTSHSFPKDIVNLWTRAWFGWQVTPAIFFSTISNDECPCGVSVQTAVMNHVVINMMFWDGISVFLFWLFYKLRKLKAHTYTHCTERILVRFCVKQPKVSTKDIISSVHTHNTDQR